MHRPTKAKLACYDEDRISALPDEIIAHILSLLPPKEALATSLLSKRWRYLWISYVRHLDFDDEAWGVNTAQFVELVDGVLQRYNKSGDHDRSLDRFCIDCEGIRMEHKSCIGRWIKFALSKRVKEFELKVIDFPIETEPEEFVLSSDIFSDADGVSETWPQNSSPIPPGSWTVGLTYLKNVLLEAVSIEGKFIDYLLANCLVLEQLVLSHSSVSKSKLRVSGQLLKLKVLHIESCFGFTDVEICNVNLVSLTFKGRNSLCINNVPQLVESCFFWLPVIPLRQPGLDGILNSISHVQILKLEFDLMKNMHIPEQPQLRNVMQLEITLHEVKDSSLLLFARFIEACPNLQRFILKTVWWGKRGVKKGELQKIVGFPLRCLELVEFRGWYGESSHHDLVRYLIKNAVALKRLVVDPRPLFKELKFWHAEEAPEEEGKSRQRAKQQLEGKLPSRVELMII